MLNISENAVDRDRILEKQSSYKEVTRIRASRTLVFVLGSLLALGIALLFLPWTQNIRARGVLTTLQPEDRQQNIHSLISGRIENWYVREGQFVEAGDTIVLISETKAEYLDPQLIERTRNQMDAKAQSVDTYRSKAGALADQKVAITENLKLTLAQAQNTLEQARLKLLSDSIDYETANITLEIARDQLARQEKLYEQGLKSLTELQQRRQKFQEEVNKNLSYQNKWMASKNAYVNAVINLQSIETSYKEKLAKVESDRLSALSMALEAEGELQKLTIQQSSYNRRAGFYAITAPQDGFVTRAMVTGIGESVKEGQTVFSFVPQNYELAVEIFVRPMDLPLIQAGNPVQLQFDGWPALVFNGWPGLSFGTYSGQVVAFDRVATKDGKFRVLVAPDPNKEPWPDLLRLGSGVYGIALLKTVPVWYELWRNLNGFPPDFYHTNLVSDEK